MTATILEIDNRTREMGFMIPDLDRDFDYHVGETVDSEIVLRHPNMSLFGLDDRNRRAIFVETPLDIDLTEHPFYYVAQYQQAQRLIVVPYDELLRISDVRGPVEHLIIIYSTGRCGSTLLSNVFGEVDHILSLSEPDVYSNLVWLRQDHPEREAEFIDLTRACTRLLCKPSPQIQQPKTYVIKHRNWAVRLADLQFSATPQAKNLFLYRHAATWMASFLRLRQPIDPLDIERMMALWIPIVTRFHPEVVALMETLDGRLPTEGERMAVTWAGMLALYERWQQMMPFLAVRYEDLNAQRETVVKAIFEYCGVSSAAVTSALTAFDNDSQAGTPLARADAAKGNRFQLDEALVADLETTLASATDIPTPGYQVTGTLQI